jgi:hypothetical protein
MSTNVTEFNVGLEKWKGLTRTQSVLAQRKVTLQVLRGVIRANPVDTGRMRSAWQATVGSPASGETGDSGASLAALQFGQASFVVNNVEYAGHCNNRHPTKAHFVEAVLENVAGQFGASS